MKRKEKLAAKRREQQEEEDEQVLPSEDSDLDAVDFDEGEGGEGDQEELKEETFQQQNVYRSKELDEMTKKLKDDFYNRLNSKKLIKKQGKIPFVEHMTLINDGIVVLPENAAVHNDLKRELCFYNLTLQDTQKAIEMLLQANVKIGRPNDYFAEMMKSDEHMRKIKAKVLKQGEKIRRFEDKKLRLDNKKFRKSPLLISVSD